MINSEIKILGKSIPETDDYLFVKFTGTADGILLFL